MSARKKKSEEPAEQAVAAEEPAASAEDGEALPAEATSAAVAPSPEPAPAGPPASEGAAEQAGPVEDSGFDDDEEGPSAVRMRRLVVFYLAGQRYAVPTERVQEIQQIVALRQVPETVPAVVGMIDLRGDVIPALDMRTLLGLPFRTYGMQTPMVILHAHDHVVAAVVDEVQDVMEVPEPSLQQPSRLHALADRLLAVCRVEDDLILILDLDALLPEEGLPLMPGGAYADTEDAGPAGRSGT